MCALLKSPIPTRKVHIRRPDCFGFNFSGLSQFDFGGLNLHFLSPPTLAHQTRLFGMVFEASWSFEGPQTIVTSPAMLENIFVNKQLLNDFQVQLNKDLLYLVECVTLWKTLIF